MKGFDERTRAFETKFARENENEFKVNMKACSILAKHIAEEKLGLDKKATDRYCEKLLSLSVQNCSLSTLHEHISKRLKKQKIDMSIRELEALYAMALGKARAESLA